MRWIELKVIMVGVFHLVTYGNGNRELKNLSRCKTRVVLGLNDYLCQVILLHLVTLEYPFLVPLRFRLLHRHLLYLDQTLDRASNRHTRLAWRVLSHDSKLRDEVLGRSCYIQYSQNMP